MNIILIEKINNNLSKIIGSYLLPNIKNFDFRTLNRATYNIKEKLNINFVIDMCGNVKGVNNFDNCKIVNRKSLNLWTIREKNYTGKTDFLKYSQ